MTKIYDRETGEELTERDVLDAEEREDLARHRRAQPPKHTRVVVPDPFLRPEDL